MGGGGTLGWKGGNIPKVHGWQVEDDGRQESCGATGNGGGGTAVFGRGMPHGVGENGAGCAKSGLCEENGGGATNRGGASAG